MTVADPGPGILTGPGVQSGSCVNGLGVPAEPRPTRTFGPVSVFRPCSIPAADISRARFSGTVNTPATTAKLTPATTTRPSAPVNNRANNAPARSEPSGTAITLQGQHDTAALTHPREWAGQDTTRNDKES